jgi:hypothetical protein
MKRWIIVLAATLAVFAVIAGAAFAADPVQSATQSSSTDQNAVAASSATQIEPSNQNISVRVLSPGNDGAVDQSNEATSNATATNNATTTQTANQTQSSNCGCVPWQDLKSGRVDDVLGGAMNAASGTGAADPAAEDSSAAAPATAAAPAAAPAPSGSTQANDASSAGTSTNAAPTTQTASQSGSSGGSGVQSSQQDASTHQAAVAESSATQVKPSNSNISVRVLSPGNDGAVSQSNEADSTADATNTATTTQSSNQNQGGSGSGVQSSTQSADTKQLAVGLSSATQIKPENKNLSVRILSPGNGGSVSQENEATSNATATNSAPVTQTSTQTDPSSSCGCHSSGPAVQAIGQKSEIEQAGFAASSAFQLEPKNTNEPIRIASGGNDGYVDQSNEASSDATTTNTAPVTQTGTQSQAPSKCGCSDGPAVQAIGQLSDTKQLGVALSSAKQIGASNENAPIRIWSWGDGGSVSQENEAESSATATNTAPTTQYGTQTQSGSGVQAIGQKADTWQKAFGLSSAEQYPGKSECGCGDSFGNSSAPVRIWSPGYDGSVDQSNEATSTADASNYAPTTQTGTQTQYAPSCGCKSLGVQALGQYATVDQLAAALSAAKQIGATNKSEPIRIKSYGGGGSTDQENEGTSDSSAPNSAKTLPSGMQYRF